MAKIGPQGKSIALEKNAEGGCTNAPKHREQRALASHTDTEADKGSYAAPMSHLRE